ncbi:2'-5' RNA ligase family protein [Brevundimonas goettingensis]|uniref:2'-5' RNA ligase family protein n=1 Tax=Brevundimonas goettingensis TaxID=2774190 RepID=A0A975C5S9_9CAUL|nr:2'-5' RNA ligase family protein [Brevundimonas goettingensis]QTC92974.1 2'-5' RNA ligase family protein [Brevundimonas goettingensis]
MPDTADLFGEAEAPRALTDRLFFGLFPDAATAQRIAALGEDLKRKHGMKSKVHAVDRLHVTLFHLGDFPGLPNDLVRKATAAAEGMKAEPFEVTFDHATSFAGRPKNRPFILKGSEAGLADLQAYRAAVGLALASQGVKTAGAFTPHVTLLYDDPIIEPDPIAPISWTVRELVLVRSLLGQGVHEHIGRWPLKP